MKIQFLCALATTATVFFSGCATQMKNDPNAPTGSPDATLTLNEVQAAYYGAAGTGTGTLHFNGAKHEFGISSLGAGGTGAQSVAAKGKVYNLERLSDFPGTYTGVRTGLTLIQGVMHEKLSNEKGTVIYLEGKTSGLASATGADKLVVTLK